LDCGVKEVETPVEPQDDPDVQLMLAVKRDDVEAFETLFRKYAQRLVAVAFSFVQSQARAEEIAQETFVQVYRTRHRYEPRARFATWLYRIATNLCVSEMRRAEHRLAARPTLQSETGDDSGDPDALADPRSQTGEKDVLDREDIRRVRETLDQLPAQQRAALLLARGEGLSYSEVAGALGCSVSAVKSLIHRATLTLRERFPDWGERR
jgi:RNA polymerase sigma-70 factor, ECF subfamily